MSVVLLWLKISRTFKSTSKNWKGRAHLHTVLGIELIFTLTGYHLISSLILYILPWQKSFSAQRSTPNCSMVFLIFFITLLLFTELLPTLLKVIQILTVMRMLEIKCQTGKPSFPVVGREIPARNWNNLTDEDSVLCLRGEEEWTWRGGWGRWLFQHLCPVMLNTSQGWLWV